MKHSKLISLLRALQPSELRAFDKFVSSPFFNPNKEVVRFWSCIRKEAPDFDSPNMERQRIMKKAFPKRAYKEKDYKYFSNRLLKLGESYLAWQEASESELFHERHLLRACMKRNMDKHYNFTLRKSWKTQRELPYLNADHYLREYQLQHIEYQYFDRLKLRKSNPHLPKMIQAFDHYYILNKLKHSCFLLNNEIVMSGRVESKISEELIRLIQKEDLEEQPAIQLYLWWYLLLVEGEEGYFEKIRASLMINDHVLTRKEVQVIYYAIINFCIRQLHKDNNSSYYRQELYTLYQQGIHSGALLEDGHLSPWTYKNVVRLGLRLEKYGETESFIKKNNSRLKAQFQQDALHYSMAELHYNRGNPDEALRHLGRVEFSDIYYTLDSRQLELKIMYEKKEWKVLEARLSAFAVYLNRNKEVAENVKQGYLNFVRCLEKINLHNKTPEEFRQLIERTSPLTGKSWLLDLLENLPK